ncbi:unnamed protein product [Closterium sp. Naga37s-1]|nr:unnamed protein product [Closterium sp. Naga37s-1]
MLLLLRPDHLSVDGDEKWNTRFVRVAIPSGGAEHITASEALVECRWCIEPRRHSGGGSVVHADDEGAEDTAAKGAPLVEADRDAEREGEESSEEEAEAGVVAAAAASKPTTSGKSIRHLAQHLAPGAGSAGPSVGNEELASALSNAIRALEKEGRAIARERAALVDTRNQEALVLGRVDARLGQLQGVVADSMETAQKKLTDEVVRKIDNMSTAISTTAERAITNSGVTNALHTLIALVGGSPPPRTDVEEPAATEIAEPGDAEHGKRAAGAKAENQRGAKRQRGPQAAAAVRNPSVQDILKHKWGAASRGAAPPGQPGSSSRSIPPAEAAPKPPAPAGATATMTTTVGKGKGKAEDGEAPAAAGSLATMPSSPHHERAEPALALNGEESKGAGRRAGRREGRREAATYADGGGGGGASFFRPIMKEPNRPSP